MAFKIGINVFKQSSSKLRLLFLLSVLTTTNLTAQQNQVFLSKEQAQEDIQWLRFALEYVHPRLYKYEDKKVVDARFDSFSNKLTQPISGLDFLSLVSKANATVHCGHLYTIPQDRLAKEVLNKKVLPFHIKVLENKLYVLNTCSPAIPTGSEILYINNKSSDEILNTILPGIAADGFIQTRKYRLMERYFYPLFHGFDLYYHLNVDRSSTFKIEYIPLGSNKPKSATVNGISIKERAQLLSEKYHMDEQAWFKLPSPTFTVNESKKYALLKLPRSFLDKNMDRNFDSLLYTAFHLIKSKGIQNLILDLRDNEGGSEYQQMELMSYLYDQPFKLYQNIYLSHLDFRPLKPIIQERDTALLVFNNEDAYMRKINESLWINNYDYSNNLQLRPPKANVFKGNLYVLMNGACFSSAADLIADIKKTREAVFIGEESGGTFEGPTGGDAIVVQLPHSKIMVRISPNIQIGYRYQKHPLGRGVLPDYPVRYTIQDILAKRDFEMELALSMIEAKK